MDKELSKKQPPEVAALIEAGQALYEAVGNYRAPNQGFLTDDLIRAGERWVQATRCIAIAREAL